MKKIILTITIVAFALLSGKLSAQSFKFASINSSELMQAMPELTEVQNKMETYGKDLEQQIEELQVEVNKKLDAYQKIESTLTDEVKLAKQNEIVEMRRKVQERGASAEEEFATEYRKSMEPVQTKLRNAINKVGKSNGFTYIFDLAPDANTGVVAIPFLNPDQVVDANDLVKKELGITK